MKKIPLARPYLGRRELRAIKKVLDSGQLTHGPKVVEFEQNFAKYIGVSEAVSFNSCASALFAVIKSLGIKGEVIMPSFTFSATANAVEAAGARPIFADVEQATRNLDPNSIKEAISHRTEAVMVVHYGGQSANLKKIRALCSKHHLALIEDSAEAIGATYQGKKTGSFGYGCFSFHPVKNMTTGEGGMVTTRDRALATKMRTLASHGIPKIKESGVPFWHRAAEVPGYNFRLQDMSAALGLVQLNKLDTMNDLRRDHANYYSSNLDSKLCQLPIESKDCYHVYQMYTIQVPPKHRASMVNDLRKVGVGASVHFDPPVHRQPYYQKQSYRRVDLKNTNILADTIITLPMYPGLTRSDRKYVVEQVNKIMKNYE